MLSYEGDDVGDFCRSEQLSELGWHDGDFVGTDAVDSVAEEGEFLAAGKSQGNAGRGFGCHEALDIGATSHDQLGSFESFGDGLVGEEDVANDGFRGALKF